MLITVFVQIGGFGALVDLKKLGYKQPQLVLGADGVGTKLEIATQANDFSHLGYDLVSQLLIAGVKDSLQVGMCVNDVLAHNAAPVAYLDYFVTGKLDKKMAAEVIKSVAVACRETHCALVGGETAEMPGIYLPHQWDLAGFCVGVREATAPELPDMAA